jgi:hypothetical protein
MMWTGSRDDAMQCMARIFDVALLMESMSAGVGFRRMLFYPLRVLSLNFRLRFIACGRSETSPFVVVDTKHEGRGPWTCRCQFTYICVESHYLPFLSPKKIFAIAY